MTDPVTLLNALRRPSLLIQAARFGMSDYRRDRDLRRLTQTTALPSPAHAMGLLMTEEDLLEQTRRTGDATYNVSRHVEVLIALMAEARLLPRPGLA